MRTGISLNPSPEDAVAWLLMADPRVARVLGMAINALVVPASPRLPFAAYTRQANEKPAVMTMGSGRSMAVTLELSIYSATYNEAREIATAVRQNIDGYVGQAYGLNIAGIVINSELDDYVTFGGEQLASAYQVTLNFTVRWQEAAELSQQEP